MNSCTFDKKFENFEPIFDQNARVNFVPIFEKSENFGHNFLKSVNFEHFVNCLSSLITP